MATVIETKDLCKTYIVDKYSNNVLQNVNFTVKDGEFVSIMGPSGSGKSTLLYTISGMDTATSGQVVFDGEEISKLSEKQLSKLRLFKMGFIFQQMYMMKKLCILDNIVLPGYQAGLASRKEVNLNAEKLMRRLGIIEIAEREITEVSGGQLQRACLCRALINNPKVIFADEPTGNLDSKTGAEIMNLLQEIDHNIGQTIIMVTHSPEAAKSCSRMITVQDGIII